MPRYVAFLRAVNVGGRTVKMAQLKDIFESIDLDSVETFIASGNVVFTTGASSTGPLVMKIERALQAELGISVPVFLRTDAEVCTIAASKYSVFTPTQVDNAHSLNIGLLHEPLSAAAVQALGTFNTSHEEFRTNGREIFMLLHTPVSNSKFTIVKFEKAIGVSTTFRKITTFQRLAAKYPGR